MSTSNAYYIPHKATWPVIGTGGLVMMLAGFANYLNGSAIGSTMDGVGADCIYCYACRMVYIAVRGK